MCNKSDIVQVIDSLLNGHAQGSALTYKKTCELCGKSFETSYKRSRFCKGPHYLVCSCCGRTFEVSKDLTYYASRLKQGKPVSCSHSCSQKLVSGTKSESERKATAQKGNRTKLLRYGSAGYKDMEKTRATKLERYGDVNYNNRSKASHTSQMRYGTDNPAKAQSVIEKAKRTKEERYGSSTFNNRDKYKRTSLERYGTDNPMRNEYVLAKLQRTNLERYGFVSTMSVPRVREKRAQTLLEKYGAVNCSQVPGSRDKAFATQTDKYGDLYSRTQEKKDRTRRTCQERYGVDNPAKSEEVKRRTKKNLLATYGYDAVSKVPEIRHKQVANAKKSLLEVRVANLLSQYNIEFEQQYVVSKDGHTHAFDFYVPKYRILVDADGKYYHSYLSDPDGKHVRDDYDDVRMYLVPEDHIFILAVEGHEEQAVKQVYRTIKQMNKGAYDYEGELFRWCRAVGFPYPTYTTERMEKDWSHLCQYEFSTYKPNCRIGMSVVSHFHRSVFDCRVGSCKSVREAWEDDNALKRVIANRLVYQNTVNPSKVLAGFNICKEAPIVSRFNPVLAKYLVRKYLNEFDEVFDPFSGFSGRLLGTAACDKKYVGQDIRWQAVEESNQIIRFLNLKGCSVSQQDVLQSSGTYECLLTCPPYSDKETYGSEVCYKSCDEWIDECLRRFKCRKYVFVVDETEKYKDFVVEEVQNSSHFSKAVERVIAISQLTE